MAKPKSVIKDAVKRLGGPTKTANLVGVSNQAVHLWIKTGKVTRTEHAVRLAELAGLEVRELV